MSRVTADCAPRELPEVDFALTAVDEQPGRATQLLLRRVIDPDAPRRRCDNFGCLAEALADLRSPRFADLPAGSSPLVFPIEVDDKAAVVERLRRSGIRSTGMWAVAHPALAPGECPGADALRARLVGLPVHQELRRDDIARIANSARTAVVRHPASVAVPIG